MENKNNNQTCKHYWRINTPDGPTSIGKCKYCGEEREFVNNFEDILMEKKHKKASDSL